MISYSQNDVQAKYFSELLYNGLQKKGATVWLDIKMESCDESAMQEAVEHSDMVLAIISAGQNAEFTTMRGLCASTSSIEPSHPEPIIPVGADDKTRIGLLIRYGKSRGIDLGGEDLINNSSPAFLNTSWRRS